MSWLKSDVKMTHHRRDEGRLQYQNVEIVGRGTLRIDAEEVRASMKKHNYHELTRKIVDRESNLANK